LLSRDSSQHNITSDKTRLLTQQPYRKSLRIRLHPKAYRVFFTVSRLHRDADTVKTREKPMPVVIAPLTDSQSRSAKPKAAPAFCAHLNTFYSLQPNPSAPLI
jgi:hypothetical protein